MKTRKFTSLIAVGSILPLAAWAQSDTGGSTNTTTTTPSSAAASDWESQRDQTGTTARDSASETRATDTATTADTADWSRDSSMATTSATAGEVQRVTQDDLEQQATASSIIGKDVVDRDGNKVGTVKDISIASLLPASLHQGTDTASSEQTIGATIDTALERVTSPSTDVNVYVSVGGFMGMGNDLIAVPVSRLQSDGDGLKIDMTQDELKSIADNEQRAMSAAE